MYAVTKSWNKVGEERSFSRYQGEFAGRGEMSDGATA